MTEHPTPPFQTARKKLFEKKQEPVAWGLRKSKDNWQLLAITKDPKLAQDWARSLKEVVPLYASGLEWFGLTEEEIMSNPEYFIHRWYYERPERLALLDWSKSLEAKLREKNT